jgi:hypothetical protein
MNVSTLESKLLKAARKSPPDDKVPYAFEKRIMANLGTVPARNIWLSCGNSLWRAAFSCIAITVLCGLWSFAHLKTNDTETFAQDFEGAVYATLDQHAEDAW